MLLLQLQNLLWDPACDSQEACDDARFDSISAGRARPYDTPLVGEPDRIAQDNFNQDDAETPDVDRPRLQELAKVPRPAHAILPVVVILQDLRWEVLRRCDVKLEVDVLELKAASEVDYLK